MCDEPLTRGDLKKLLDSGNEEERLYYAAKILREARFEEVWDYLSRCFWPLIGKDFAGDWDARNGSGSSFTLRGVSMALSSKDILSALQWDFLSFFSRGSPFLNRGTALSALSSTPLFRRPGSVHVGHGAFDRVPLYVADTGTRLNASVASLQTAPQFHRYRLSRNQESVIVDFVKEVVPQISQVKIHLRERGGYIG